MLDFGTKAATVVRSAKEGRLLCFEIPLVCVHLFYSNRWHFYTDTRKLWLVLWQRQQYCLADQQKKVFFGLHCFKNQLAYVCLHLISELIHLSLGPWILILTRFTSSYKEALWIIIMFMSCTVYCINHIPIHSHASGHI